MTTRLIPFHPANATDFTDFTDHICPGCTWDKSEAELQADPETADILEDPHALWPGCPVIALVQTSRKHTGHWFFTKDTSYSQQSEPGFPGEPYCKARRTDGQIL